MSLFRSTAIFFLFSVLGLSLYELAQLKKASAKTIAIRAAYLVDADYEIDLAQVSADWIGILLAVEDPGFYEHRGIDLTTPGAGMTTITQALVKYLYFEDFQPGFKKIEQTLIARYVMDTNFTKEEQLDVFLNTAYLGSVDGKPVRGFQEAAKQYFERDFLSLSERQYISLVAMLVAPNLLDVNNNTERNQDRVDRIYAVLEGAYTPESLTDIYYDRE